MPRLSSLQGDHPRRFDIPAGIALTIALLGVAAFLPVLTVERIASRERTYSVLTGIVDLFRKGNHFLSLLLLSFSVLFPLFKLGALLVLWFRPFSQRQRGAALGRLKALGKWSMLDVFVVIVTVGCLELGALAEARPRAGVYLFASAILLSMLATLSVESLASRSWVEPSPALPTARRRELAALSTLAILLFSVGLVLPLMEVEKWAFWQRDYSILTGIARLWSAGEGALAAGVFLFILAVPLLRLLGLLVSGLLRGGSRGAVTLRHWLARLDAWSMAEVFALALLIVGAKLGNLVTIRPRSGLWFFVTAVVLSVYVSARAALPRRFRAPRR